jgi:hypothetical protein
LPVAVSVWSKDDPRGSSGFKPAATVADMLPAKWGLGAVLGGPSPGVGTPCIHLLCVGVWCVPLQDLSNNRLSGPMTPQAAAAAAPAPAARPQSTGSRGLLTQLPARRLQQASADPSPSNTTMQQALVSNHCCCVAGSDSARLTLHSGQTLATT